MIPSLWSPYKDCDDDHVHQSTGQCYPKPSWQTTVHGVAERHNSKQHQQTKFSQRKITEKKRQMSIFVLKKSSYLKVEKK